MDTNIRRSLRRRTSRVGRGVGVGDAGPSAGGSGSGGRGSGGGGRGGGRRLHEPRQNQGLSVNVGQDVGCKVCNCMLRFASHTAVHFAFDVDLKDWQTSSSAKRQAYLTNFLQMVNTFLNEAGGFVLIHSVQAYLAFFDEQVDSRLMAMIPDGFMFDEKFRRVIIDNRHISFEVLRPAIPRRPAPLSVTEFHTTISLNRGRAVPSYANMKHLLTRQHGSPTPLASPFLNTTLMKDQVFPFTESRSMQAKVVMSHSLETAKGRSRGEKLLNLCWFSLKLPDYISAFSKQLQGGHYCLGLEEEKENRGQKWLQVQGMEQFCKVLGTDMKVWEDKQSPGHVLYIAEDRNVPEYANKTGRYILRGVRLLPSDQIHFQSYLDNYLRAYLLWYPTQSRQDLNYIPQVECAFHPVLEPNEDKDEPLGAVGGSIDQYGIASGFTDMYVDTHTKTKTNRALESVYAHKDLYIVEISVGYYPGVCFQDKDGPEAYCYQHRTNPAASKTVVRASAQECCRRLKI